MCDVAPVQGTQSVCNLPKVVQGFLLRVASSGSLLQVRFHVTAAAVLHHEQVAAAGLAWNENQISVPHNVLTANFFEVRHLAVEKHFALLFLIHLLLALHLDRDFHLVLYEGCEVNLSELALSDLLLNQKLVLRALHLLPDELVYWLALYLHYFAYFYRLLGYLTTFC